MLCLTIYVVFTSTNASSVCAMLSTLQEDHGQPLFGVQFNWFLEDKYFASVGSNRVCMPCILTKKL